MDGERRICRVLGQYRSTQRRRPGGCADEERLVSDMTELARQYGSYGYRRVAVLLRDAGWQVSDGRIERLWRREGLKVPPKQPKRGRLWLNDGSCVRLRPEYRNHVPLSVIIPITCRSAGRMTSSIAGRTMGKPFGH